MTRRRWTIHDNVVLRNGQPIARIVPVQKGLGFYGLVRPLLGFRRIGFTSRDDLLADVKYFYHYPPRTTVWFAKTGGRTRA